MGRKNKPTNLRPLSITEMELEAPKNDLEESKCQSNVSTYDSDNEPQGRNPQSVSPVRFQSNYSNNQLKNPYEIANNIHSCDWQ